MLSAQKVYFTYKLSAQYLLFTYFMSAHYLLIYVFMSAQKVYFYLKYLLRKIICPEGIILHKINTFVHILRKMFFLHTKMRFRSIFLRRGNESSSHPRPPPLVTGGHLL